MKTNDVTGRFKEGEAGFAIELGRPGISSSFEDLERVSMALAGYVEFEPLNPVTGLLDIRTGKLKDVRVKGERVLSAIIECKTTMDKGLEILDILKKVADEIDTVFSVCIVNKCKDFEISFKRTLEEAGYAPRINGKTNVGLGRPLVP